MQAGHVGRKSHLHTAAGQLDGIEVILHLGLDLSQADEFVQLSHRGIGSVPDSGNILREHQLQQRLRGNFFILKTRIHGRDNRIVEKVLHQQCVLKAGPSMIVLMKDEHLQLPAGLLGKRETAPFATDVEHAKQLSRLEVLQIYGLCKALLQFRIA